MILHEQPTTGPADNSRCAWLNRPAIAHNPGMVQPQIRYAKTSDGVNTTYVVMAKGAPVWDVRWRE